MISNSKQSLLIGLNTTVVEAMTLIDKNTNKILYVVDQNGKLCGSVTDGDLRRWIIRTGKLNATALEYMYRDTKYLFEGNQGNAFAFMKCHQLLSLPIVDAKMRIVDIIFADVKQVKKKNTSLRNNTVIIMAGGKGTRLYPFTKILPKPLIPIGEVPIVERIINQFCQYGISEYYLTINYKKGMIKAYFSDLSPDYTIHYVEEDKPLGTAGSIRLIRDKFCEPVIITNCDTLINIDYSSLVEYHKKSGNALTIVSSLKNMVVPYGVIHPKENGIVASMEEKPKMSYFINSGLYVLNPEQIEKIPRDTVYHMPQLAEQLMRKGLQVGMYPISEEAFLDMGEFEEMKRMEKKLGFD